MITVAGNTFILSSVVAAIDAASVISVRNASGEFFRKIPTATEIISPHEINFTFYLNESEANDTIVGFSLYADATDDFGTGTEIATQALIPEEIIVKDNTQSLAIDWTVNIL